MPTSLAQRAAALPADERDAWLRSLTPAAATQLLADWEFWARPNQLAPDGAWLTWLILAGRGFGKTRAGAEWVLDRISAGAGRVALIGRTAADVRDVMVEGESGLVACAERRGYRAAYEPSKRRVVVTVAGRTAVCTTYSAEEPDQTRGPQHDTAWADELAAWPNKRDAVGNTAWSNLLMGLRLGDDPRVVVTTTPKPTPLMRELTADPRTIITRGSTYENLANLAPTFRDTVVAKYEGTRVGRQELMGELLEDVEGALWTGAIIETSRVRTRPDLARIVVAVDPAVTSTGDETGIVVVGLGYDGDCYVLDDRSTRGTPDTWARRVIRAWLDHGADVIVAEANQGGDMVAATLRTAAAAMAAEGAPTRTVPTRTVHASRGKRARAEPVSALYEQGRIHHIGTYPELEDQMTTWTPESGASPDRLDALVWAVTHLVLAPAAATFQEW
jgi:predicted phage terminase large subunit-like protein